MVNIVAFGPGDPGSHPEWFAVSNLNQIINLNLIIQACGTLASAVAIVPAL